MDLAYQKQKLQEYSMKDAEIEGFLNDPRLLALAQMKLMDKEDRDFEAEKKENELKEMVAYVLNAKPDDNLVELITDRLA